MNNGVGMMKNWLCAAAFSEGAAAFSEVAATFSEGAHAFSPAAPLFSPIKKESGLAKAGLSMMFEAYDVSTPRLTSDVSL